MNLVLTMASGKRCGALGSITVPRIKEYAEKIGAEFICWDKEVKGNVSPHFRKFEIYNLLDKYDRIIWMDCDMLIRDDTPNLFDIVKEDEFGAFDENPFTTSRPESLMQAVDTYKIEIPKEIIKKWKGDYFNTGLMVISKCHKNVFENPEKQHLLPFYEQSLINARLLYFETKMKKLSHLYNRMTCCDPFTGEDRHNAYIIHYAGCPMKEKDYVDLLKRDVDIWKQNAPGYKFKSHLLIEVVGGMGDQVSVEPVVRRMVEKEYKDWDVHVITHFPRFYSHFKEYDNVSLYSFDNVMMRNDVPFIKLKTIAEEDSPYNHYAFHGFIHQIDYSSILLLKRQIPNEEKRIKIKVGISDIQELTEAVGNHEFKTFTIIHPGKGWKSKTFPNEFWEGILIELKEKGIKNIAIVGKYINEKQGTTDIKIPEGIYDWRNKLSLNAFIGLISQANVLITNDSSPVHIAGAFDNNIILIPSCKHPEQVLPYRHGNQDYKAVAMYKKLMLDFFYDRKIKDIENLTTADVPPDTDPWEYLPEVNCVVGRCINMINMDLPKNAN